MPTWVTVLIVIAAAVVLAPVAWWALTGPSPRHDPRLSTKEKARVDRAAADAYIRRVHQSFGPLG